ncbi:hypothetical protein [Peribacillus sp. NPDC097895]|uniref:hypothetical protein n=1 Tax=Peribacillus sp. NPDC097895 TaxID=3390619 RepID=UPI003D04F1CD
MLIFSFHCKKIVELEPEATTDNVFDEVKYIVVDGEEGTYIATEKEISEPIPTISTLATSSKSAWVKAKTDDPVGVNLCTTKLNFSWYDPGSTVGYKSRSLSTWSANPSSLGTHWYTKGSSVSNPSQPSSKSTITQKAYGYYYNYDFLNDDKITNVNEAKINPQKISPPQ